MVNFFFFWKKMFPLLFKNGQISLKLVAFDEKGTDYDLDGVTGGWVQADHQWP